MSIITNGSSHPETTTAPLSSHWTNNNNHDDYGGNFRFGRKYVVFKEEENESPDNTHCNDHPGSVSAFTLLNFIISSLSIAVTAVSNTNSNINNNNNNNNDNNNNDNNVNIGNTNNNANNQNMLTFLPMMGKRKKRSEEDSAGSKNDVHIYYDYMNNEILEQLCKDRLSDQGELARIAIQTLDLFRHLEHCKTEAAKSDDCQGRIFCGELNQLEKRSPWSRFLLKHLFKGAGQISGLDTEDVVC